MKEYNNIMDLLAEVNTGIHIECTQEQSEYIFQKVRTRFGEVGISYILHTDRGYESNSVREYLKLFEHLQGSEVSYKSALKEFGLAGVQKKKLKACTASELMRVNFARISLAEQKYHW